MSEAACSCLSCGCALYYGLKAERDVLRVENERLADGWAAANEREKGLEAEVERLKSAARVDMAWMTDQAEQIEELKAQRCSLQITDEVVDALRPYIKDGYLTAVRVALEAAVWPTPVEEDLIGRVEAKMHDIEFLGRLRRLIAQERGVLDRLAQGTTDCRVSSPEHDDLQLWPFSKIDERDDDR